MKWLKRFWLAHVRYRDYCFIHDCDKQYTTAIHPGPGSWYCGDCERDKEAVAKMKRNRAIKAYHQ